MKAYDTIYRLKYEHYDIYHYVYKLKKTQRELAQKYISYDLRFCVGCMYLFINDKMPLSGYVIQKEDYERTLISFNKYGGVLRYNNICVKTKFYSLGGLGKDRNELNEKNTATLISMFPTQLKMWRRKNGTAEVKFVKQPKK